MSNEPKIPSHLRPDLSEDMYRTEMWLKAGVNPINGHKLITQEQANHLLAYRDQLMALTDNPRQRWNQLHAYTTSYLAQLPEEQRRPQIVRELNETIHPDKPFNENIYYTAEEFSRQFRRSGGGFRNSVRPANPPAPSTENMPTPRATKPEKPEKPDAPARAPRIKVDGEALDKTWHDFASAHHITAAQAGAAARKLRSDTPFAPNSVNQQRFLLRKQGVVSPFFQYIHRQPDAFFTALEAQIGQPIAAADRQPLLDQLAEALNGPATTRSR